MKKIAVVIMLFGIALALLSGCSGSPKNLAESTPKTSAGQSAPETTPNALQEQDTDNDTEQSSAPDSLTAANNPSEGYENYITVKSAAIERMVQASEGSDALAMTVAFSVIGYSMMDLSLIWLTVFTDDIVETEAAFGFLGLNDVKITSNGNDFTITYKDTEGNAAKQTCNYDAVRDQLTSTMYDGDNKVTMFFEYVNLGGNTYAAQYYYPEDGSYQIVRAFFDTTDVAAFGTLNASEEPASIIGKAGFNEDFVMNEEAYCILKDGQLSSFDNGTLTTN